MGSTIGINAEITAATKNDRIVLGKFYKGMSVDSINFKTPMNILANNEEVIDLSKSSCFILVAEDYALENSVIDLTFKDSLDNEFTISGIGFIQLNFSNLMQVTIKNTSDNDIDINLFY